MNASLLLAALAALGQSTPVQNHTPEQEASFRSTFRVNSIENCVVAAKKPNAPVLDYTAICACVTDKMLATKTVAELSQPLKPEDTKPAVMACVAANRPNTSGAN